jgi:hypothetical protein
MMDGVSPELARFLNSLTADERASLVEVLRDPRTFLAEDMTDVLAILNDIQK